MEALVSATSDDEDDDCCALLKSLKDDSPVALE